MVISGSCLKVTMLAKKGVLEKPMIFILLVSILES
uniref:Uncharacterized protein n=1 Tax=Rhizophora mucronata TaxID=61149 RepID=A0A2P2NIR1_RHIMU